MCFGSSDTPKAEAPAPPAETLKQSAPTKKGVAQAPVSSTTSTKTSSTSNTGTRSTAPTVSTNSSGALNKIDDTNADKLSIGTKRYRNRFSLPGSGLTSVSAPSGIPVNI